MQCLSKANNYTRKVNIYTMRVEIFKEEEFEVLKGYKNFEQEIVCVKTRDEDKWEISVTDNTMLTKLRKRFLKSEGKWKAYKEVSSSGNIQCYYFDIPSNGISFKSGGRTKRTPMSEEQRKAASARMKAMFRK